MSEAKHTPGPWTFENHSPAVPLLGIYAPDNKSPWHADRSDAERAANARLAAASPELYAALRATMKALSYTVSYLYSKQEPTDEIGEMVKESRELFHKALDKAIGDIHGNG